MNNSFPNYGANFRALSPPFEDLALEANNMHFMITESPRLTKWSSSVCHPHITWYMSPSHPSIHQHWWLTIYFCWLRFASLCPHEYRPPETRVLPDLSIAVTLMSGKEQVFSKYLLDIHPAKAGFSCTYIFSVNIFTPGPNLTFTKLIKYHCTRFNSSF